MSKKTVFISSTYEDLIGHRKSIWEVLEKFDVHVNGMENFGARKDSPLKTCLEEVERSDIYVGIISMKYGSVDTKLGKSFTELEYEKALELGKDKLIYLNHETASIQANHIDLGEKSELLLNFKEKLKEKHTVDFYTTPDDLSGKLKNILKDKLDIKRSDESSIEVSEILNKFYLFPNMYSGKEIELKVNFNQEPYPASKTLCNTFGLSYGDTIIQPIKVIEPNNGSPIKELIFTKENAEHFFDKTVSDDILILARLLFSQNRIEQLEGYFFDETRKTIEYDTDALYQFSSSAYNRPLPHAFAREKIEHIEGEGKAILLFRKFLTETEER
jgi:hypothetical protein